MSTYYCNPLNLPYKYNYQIPNIPGIGEPKLSVYREAADPTLEYFKGKYYLFPSMTAGFYVSENMTDWEYHKLEKPIPVFDYAPDVRAIGDYLYFCASKRSGVCNFYRSKDPEKEPFEEIPGTLAFWDPDLFQDDDGRIYLYWGCSNVTPLWGTELDPETMSPLTEPVVLFSSDTSVRGYERTGMDHVSLRAGTETEAQAQELFRKFKELPLEIREREGLTDDEKILQLARGFASDAPYIEGAYMTKYQGRYYLQYAFPASETNVYGDGVLIGEHPLGPFRAAENNPFSYKPGGFINGAGHGSTIADAKGSFWHSATMSISVNNSMERRIGLWKAGFDNDGELYCDQRYGDWPVNAEAPAFTAPEFMLLSYRKLVRVSSGTGAQNITNESIRDWWRAEGSAGEWICLDLEKEYDIRAIQVNFADEGITARIPTDADCLFAQEIRYIELQKRPVKWVLEGSLDGENYFVIQDKREDETSLSNDFLYFEQGITARWLKLTITEMPFNQMAAVSGLRVFGIGSEALPEKLQNVKAVRTGELDMHISWDMDERAVGYNILWGHAPDKLYHSYMVFDTGEKVIRALMKDSPVWVRIDVFNEGGITEGEILGPI